MLLDKFTMDRLQVVVTNLRINLAVRFEAATYELDSRGRVFGTALRRNAIDVRCLLELERESSALIVNTVGADLELADADALHLW